MLLSKFVLVICILVVIMPHFYQNIQVLDDFNFIDSIRDINPLSVVHQHICCMRNNFDYFITKVSSRKKYPEFIILQKFG